MIEREFIRTKIKHLQIRDRIEEIISKNAGVGSIIIEKTPLGEKITISAVRPGLVIGRGGETIKMLTQELKIRYKLENPQIEVKEIPVPALDATVVAKQIAAELENFGIKRFKSSGYRMLDSIIRAGALGAEIRMSGKVPGARAKTWLFYKGYLKKSGDVALNYVDSSIQVAKTRPGIVGIKVRIMHQGTPLPDIIIPKQIVHTQEVTGKEAEKMQQEIKEIVAAQEIKEVKPETQESKPEEKVEREKIKVTIKPEVVKEPESKAITQVQSTPEIKKETKKKVRKKKTESEVKK